MKPQGGAAERVGLYLNLDAEEQLEYSRSSGARAPGARDRATLSAIASAGAILAPRLPAGLVALVPAHGAAAEAQVPKMNSVEQEVARGLTHSLLWCPTKAARAEVERLGLQPLQALDLALGAAFGLGARTFELGAQRWPSDEVLAWANDRATFAGHAPLPGGTVVRTRDEARGHLVSASLQTNFVLRRALSAAGRGARRIRGGAAPAAGDDAWLEAALARGPLTVDPVVSIETEYAQHGWLSAEGVLTLGAPCVQDVDPHGRHVQSRRLEQGLELGLRGALEAATRRVAADLAALGFQGPFGVDAYRWRGADGALHLRAPSEVNARFTMGWWTGMASAADH